MARPCVFQNAVGAAIEAAILGEVVEGVARAVEAASDVMTAIVSRAPIRATGPSLQSSGAPLGQRMSESTIDPPRPKDGIAMKGVAAYPPGTLSCSSMLGTLVMSDGKRPPWVST